MKLLYLSLFTGIASTNAFQPADHWGLQSKVIHCTTSDGEGGGSGGIGDGTKCYACDDGTMVTSASASCSDSSTPTFITDWDTSLLTEMHSMFSNRVNFNHPLNWDTSSVTKMDSMFIGTTNFNQPLNWDTSKVIDFDYMFHSSGFNENISSWDVSSTTDFTAMFQNAIAFNQDISAWDMSSAKNLYKMFGGSSATPNKFNQDISPWDTSSVTKMSYMFERCEFDQDISCWDVSAVTTFSAMFFYGDMSKTICWDTGSADTSSAFANAVGGSFDSTCTPVCITCPVNEKVESGACVACPAGKYSDGGKITECSCMVPSGAQLCDIGGTLQECTSEPPTTGFAECNGGHKKPHDDFPRRPDATAYGTHSSYDKYRGIDHATHVADCRRRCFESYKKYPNDYAPFAEINHQGSDSSLTQDRLCGCIEKSTGCTLSSRGNDAWTAHDLLAGGTCITTCAVNQKVESGACVNCDAGYIRPVGDDMLGADTVCTLGYCLEGEKVESGACVACPAGKTTPGEGLFTECVKAFFKPADKAALKAAIDACVDASTKDGSECYACADGTMHTSTSGTCAVGEVGFIEGWDTSLVTDMKDLFKSKSKFNQDISKWDVSKVTTFEYMFKYASDFNQDLSCWDISSAATLHDMFRSSDLSGTLCWDTSGKTVDGMVWDSGSPNAVVDSSCTATGCLDEGDTCSLDIACASGICDTVCKSPICAENEHVSGGMCTACPAGDINDAGDDPKQADTSCTTPPRVCDACTVPLDMKAVPVGTKVVCEDPSIHCSGEWVKYGGGCYHPTCIDTQSCCGPCITNQHVSSGICEACPVGRHRASGDLPPKTTECWADGTCGGDTCVDANTQSCTNHACNCKIGFGGVTCQRDVTATGMQKMLQESRKKALPSRQDLIQRQNTIKTYARDTLKQKLKEGKSVKDAISETMVTIQPSDLPQKAQAIVQQLAKVPVVAVAPANKDEDDTCDQGVNTAGCGMVDIGTSHELVLLSTDPDPGSWSVLASEDKILSKQTRISDFVYEMQCWDNGWGTKQSVNTTNGAELYECNGNVIMISSQAGICTPTICGNGNCTVDGSSYVCSCEAGWSGTHCNEASVLSQCHEFDCSNYGGHKSLAHCGGTCSASICCNHATKSAFDAVCNALTTSADYVSNKCCHRDICI